MERSAAVDPQAPRPHNPYPARVGRYELVVPLGVGGMATVFLARQMGPGGFEREVAVKLLHPHLRQSREWLEPLFEEARLAARIRHPNVVQVLDVGEGPEGAFLAMEYVEGDSLAGLLRGAEAMGIALARPVAMRILCDALAGLHAAHELRDDRGFALGLVHRDFSPQNLLAGTDGVARLADFGIAKAASRVTVTRTGVIKGKVAYMSPEQARGQPLDRRSDVWSAGVVAWEIAAGRRLFAAEDEIAAGLRIVSERPPRLRDVDPSAPAALDEAIAWALTPEVDARCPTADELRRRLAAAVPLAEPAAVAEQVAELAAPTLEQRRAAVTEALRTRRAAAAPPAASRGFRKAVALAAAIALPLAAVGGWRLIDRARRGCDADLQTAGDHCGACNHSCLGGACVDGQCHPMLLVTHQQPYGIAIDATHLYWAVIGEGSVYKLAKSGEPRTLRRLFTRRRGPRFLAVDDRFVYVTVLEGGEVIRIGKDGDPASLTILATGQNKPWEIAIDATHVYFGNGGDGALRRVAKQGGPVETIAVGADTGGIAVDDQSVYWLDRASASAGSVRRWSKRDPPGQFVVLAENQARPAAIAVDREAIYWTNFNGGTVNALAKDAAPLSRPRELARGQRAPTGITATDPDWIYFTTFSGHRVNRVSRRGGEVVILPSGSTKGPVRIAADEASLYWSASESSGLFRLAK